MTQKDERLPIARNVVEQLLGQCLLRLQAHELLMKAIIISQQLSSPIADIEEILAKRVAETKRKTMGGLVNEMLGTFLVPEGQKAPPEEITDAASVAFRVYLAFSTEEFARISAEHRDLVLLRNNLVHQFLEQEDLRTVEGCLTAQRTLTQALKRISFAYDGLHGWVLETEHARQAFMDELALPDLQNFLVHGRIPWHLATITTALNEASVALAKGDWTPVDAAANWIAERHPEEQPGGYGCRTWRQVIHEAGQFDLQVRKVDGRREAWFRRRSQEAVHV